MPCILTFYLPVPPQNSIALPHLHLQIREPSLDPMLNLFFNTIFSSLRSHQSLVLENIALRHQLDVLQRNAKRPRLKPSDRVLWALFSRFLPDWRRHLTIVQPKTVVGWHRKDWRDNCCAIHDPVSETTITNLANIHQEPHD